MNPEAFKKLCATYGADTQRWPEADRANIGELSNRHFAEMRQALDAETELDALLDAHKLEAPSAELASMILASAPQKAQTKEQAWSWWWPSLGLAGVGLAGVGLAGAVAGIMLVSLLTSPILFSGAADKGLSTSEIIDFGQDWR